MRRIRRIKYGRKFVVNLNRYLIEDIGNIMNVLLNQVESLNMKPLKKIESVLNNEILPCHSKYIQCCHAALASTESRIFKPDLPKIKSKPPEKCYD